MTWYLYFVALSMIVCGSAMILHTEKTRDVLSSLLEDSNFKLWGIIAIVLGGLLMAASFWSGVTWFLFLLGLLVVGKGVFLLLGNEEKISSLVSIWMGMSDMGLRMWGLIYVITGVAILAWT